MFRGSRYAKTENSGSGGRRSRDSENCEYFYFKKFHKDTVQRKKKGNGKILFEKTLLRILLSVLQYNH